VLDHRYVVAVTRTGPYQGELTVADGFEIAYCRSIDLTYNALLGPMCRTLPNGGGWPAHSSTAVWRIEFRPPTLLRAVLVRHSECVIARLNGTMNCIHNRLCAESRQEEETSRKEVGNEGRKNLYAISKRERWTS
jgi:hypothetical protein